MLPIDRQEQQHSIVECVDLHWYRFRPIQFVKPRYKVSRLWLLIIQVRRITGPDADFASITLDVMITDSSTHTSTTSYNNCSVLCPIYKCSVALRAWVCVNNYISMI